MANKAPDFLVHNAKDSVGVVVVETVNARDTLTGWVMETDATVSITALDAIPLGHKVALCDLSADDTVTKYGQDIGRAVANISKGNHVHVHNLKTKRW